GTACRNHAVGRMDQVDHVPLPAFRRVNGAQDEVVLVEQWRAGKVAGRRWGVECELAQECAAGDVGSGHDLELFDVLQAGERTAVAPLEDRVAEGANAGEFGGWGEGAAQRGEGPNSLPPFPQAPP